MADQPRGVRNNNPGNVKWFPGSEEWYGQMGVDWIDPLDHSKGGFVITEKAWQGYRIIAKTLLTYQRNRLAADGSAIDTVAEVIQRWAPAGPENPHQAQYIAFVRRKMGVEKGAHIDCECYATMEGLIGAMAQFETGIEKPFGSITRDALRRGIVETGIEPPRNKVGAGADPTMKATKTAGVATAAAAAAPFALADITPAFPFLSKAIQLAPWLIGAIAFGAVCYIGYRVWRSHQHGV